MDLFIREASGPVRRNGALSAAERSDSSWANSRAFAAISTDGQVRAWGDPASGGQLPGSLAPLLTRQSDTPWIWTVELASSTAAFAARRANGQVVAWGDAASGGAIPVGLETALSTGVVRLYGLGQSFVALKANGTVIHWGNSGSGVSELSGLDLSQPYQVVTSFDSLAILQNGRVLGCWGGYAGGQQWSQHSDLRSALAGDVLQLVGSETGFAARTASGQVMTWGAPQGTGDVGMSITSRPDIVELRGDANGFHGFTAKGQIRVWGVLNGQYQAGENLLKEPNRPVVPISSAVHFFRAPGGGFGWVDEIGVLQLYQYQPSLKQQFIPGVDIQIDQNPFQGTYGLAVIDQDGDLQTLGYQLGQTNKPDLASPNPIGFFSPSNKSSSADWQTVRASGGGAFAALASNGQIGLWGDPATGAIPANPQLMKQLLEQHPATQIYNNAGAFVALSDNGTAISWGDSASGGDQNGSPLILGGIDHLVSPWKNVRIDELGPGRLSLIANGEPNPDGQTTPLRVREGDRLTTVISGDPNGDRGDTVGNVYLWLRNGQAVGDPSQASINLDALSTGTWSVTPTYYDLPGFQQTLAPLTLQVEQVDNGQSRIQIYPYTFNGPANQAFSAGEGKVAELVASLSGDPEGIRSIDRVQWFRDGEAIASFGTNERSILLATEPGDYRFEATTTDNQGYTTTQSSGLIRIDPVGSVPSQSHLALAGLQTLWRLSEDGSTVERFDSTSLRMRPVDMGSTAGYLAISASSDGNAWALANDGVACVYDAIGNRFLRQDGSGSGAEQRLNLGSGWRQIVAARGSNTAPALWLLGEIPQNGGSNVAYLPSRPAPGQTLAEIKPIVVEGGPALRLLAVGDDQTPWGIDSAGNLWRWDAGSEGFALLAAGVGSPIRQLQMIDQAQVWGLDDHGVLQMWDSEKSIFKPVPLDSPFFTRRSELLTQGVTPTWESFSLSQLGGFVGIPRSGVNLPPGGNGLVAFDSSEISRLRDPSETISQLQLLSGETLQDNGERQVGQNLAFNLNEQVNVAYTLNSSRPGQWEGAAVVPGAQSGAGLKVEPGPSRDEKGSRLPVIRLNWNSSLKDDSVPYRADGFVSPFGGLVFSQAIRNPVSRPVYLAPVKAQITSPNQGYLTNGSSAAMGAPRSSLGRIAPLGGALGASGGEYTPKNKFKGTQVGGLSAGATKGGSLSYGGSWERKVGKNWKFVISIGGTLSNGSKVVGKNWNPEIKTVSNAELGFESEIKLIYNAPLGKWGNNGKKFKRDRDDSFARRQLNWSDPKSAYSQNFIQNPPDDWDGINGKPSSDAVLVGAKDKLQSGLTFAATKFAISTSLQGSASYNFGDQSLIGSLKAGAEANLSYPLWTPGGGYIQVNGNIALGVDYSREYTILSGQSPATAFPVRVLAPDGTPATSETPLRDIGFYIDIDSTFSPENNSTVGFLTDYVTPAADFFVSYINPLIQILNGNFSGAASGLTSDLLAATPDLNPMQAEQLAELGRRNRLLGAGSSTPGPSNLSKSELDFNLNLGLSVIGDFPWMYLTLSPAINLGTGTKGTSIEFLAKLDIKFLDGWLNWKEEWKWQILKPDSENLSLSANSTPSLINGNRAFMTSEPAGARYLINTGDRIKALPFDALDDSDLKALSDNPEAFIANASLLATSLDGDNAVGIYRIDSPNPNQPWLFELGVISGIRSTQNQGEVRWDWSTAQPIAGSLGLTTNVELIRLSDGRLAAAGSHIAADDMLLKPITQLAPGSIYRIKADPLAAGGSTLLDNLIPQLVLPSERPWAQLGSSLASSAPLRSDWRGNSLVAGADGSNDGAGALYILNGQALAGLSDLSTLENNATPAQGLVILGSRHSGLGQQVINGGDTNSDGFNEIFAAAPHAGAGAGLVYMLYGGKALQELPQITAGQITLDTLDGLQKGWHRNLYLQSFQGVSGSRAYGTILAGGVDLNRDGHADPLIGYAASSTASGSVELWSSRKQLQQADFQPGVLDGDRQAIPHFDRSLLLGSGSALAEQSAFKVENASSVGDLDADGYGEIVLSSDSQAALVFGDALMPVYWEAQTLIDNLAATRNPAEVAPLSQTWTASWLDTAGQRFVLSFAGADRNGDGQIRSDSQAGQTPEIDWIALRRDGDPADAQAPLVALSPRLTGRWNGALQINASSLGFDLTSRTFSGPVSLSASDANGDDPFSWSSAAAGLSPDQAARSLRARLLTSPAPGVINATGVGDFNGDGRPDLALSQAGYRALAGQGKDLLVRPGATAIVYGGGDWSDASAMALALDDVGTTYQGVRLDFGGELTAIGDWNNDSKADLLIRDPYASDQAGSHLILHGRDGGSGSVLALEQELSSSRAELLKGSSAYSLTGASAAAGDFTGDGERTLILGAPNTVSKQALLQATSGARVLTAVQNGDGSWQAPQQLPDFEGAGSGVQKLSSYAAVGARILATWVNSPIAGSAEKLDELWAAFLDPSSGRWSAAHKLQSIPRGDLTAPAIGQVEALALSTSTRTDNGQAVLEPSGGVLLAWTTTDAATGRTFLFQSIYDPTLSSEHLRWSAAIQQDPQALLLANQDAISGSKLRLQFNPGTPEQRSQIWAEASISSEDQELVTINLRRSGDLSQPLTLTYSTRDRSAAAGSQYVHSSGEVHFEAGAASASVAIQQIDNDQLENRNTSFVVDFQPQDQLRTAAQLLLGETPISTTASGPVLSVSATIQDNEVIRMRAIDAGISLIGPLTGTTGTAATASTAVNPTIQPTQTPDSNLARTIALLGDPGANEGLGQVYALFVAATSSDAANPGMDWKQLNEIAVLDQASQAPQGKKQLNVLIQPEAALAALDPRAGFGTAMVKLRLNGGTSGSIGETAFAISAPGNPLDGGKPARVYVVTGKLIEEWTNQNPNAPLILNESSSLVIEQMKGGLFGAVLAAADLDGNGYDELVIGAPGSSEVSVISSAILNTKRTGRFSPTELEAHLIRDASSNPDNGNSSFGAAIAALDLDGDTFLDLAIGAPTASPVRFGNTGPVVAQGGAVYVLKGSKSLEAFSGEIQTMRQKLQLDGYTKLNDRGSSTGPARPISEGLPPPGNFGFGESLGSALASVDLNSDGIKDLAIGAPFYTPDNIQRTGRVVSWFGKKNPTIWGQTIALGNSLSVQQGVSFVGQQDGGLVGASLASAGDLQGDKNEDLAIGAPFEDGGAGRVYVAFGSQNRYGPEALKATGNVNVNVFQLDSTNPDSPFQTFEAPEGYQLGQIVEGLGDLNNDSSTGIGGADLFLGSPAAVFAKETSKPNGDIELVPAGQTHLAWGRPWLGPNQSLDVPFTQGVGYLLPFSGVPLALGDLNGDGYGDYALLSGSNDWLETDPPDPAKKADATKLRIRFGAAVEYEQQQLLLSSFDLKPAGTPLASDQVPLVVAGDFDGDAFGDLIAYTNEGLKLLHGAPNLSVQGDAQTRWDTEGKLLSISGSSDPISHLASGDFDGDGYDDLAVVKQGPTLLKANATLSILWGSSSGLQFGGSKLLASGQSGGNNPGIDGLIALDSNGDGIDELALYGNDLAKFWSSTPKLGWGLQLLTPVRDSSDPFKKAVKSLPIVTGSNGVPSALSSGDLNGDGVADLLIDHGGNKIDLLTGNRQSFLQPSTLGFVRSQPAPDGSTLQRTQLARFVGDVNADGRDDLLFSPTSPAPLTNSSSPLKHGPYSFVYLGNSTGQGNVTIPAFWDANQDNGTSSPDRLKAWAAYGYTIESLPGEAAAYRTGAIGDINGDGFDEAGFSSNQLYVSGNPQQRPHSIFIYGASRLSPDALKTTTSNDGTSVDDTLQQLGSAGKQELLLRGKAGSDLLQVQADPYGTTLSFPNSGKNAGRLTVSASNGDALWSQPRNAYELVLRDGKLQIIRTKDEKAVKTWGNGEIDQVYLSDKGWLYLVKAKDGSSTTLTDNQRARLATRLGPLADLEKKVLPRRGVIGLAGWFENSGLGGSMEKTTNVNQSQLVFSPETGSLFLVNRQSTAKNGDNNRDNWAFNGLDSFGEGFNSSNQPISYLDNRNVYIRSSHITLFGGDDEAVKAVTEPTLTQVLNPSESLLSGTRATLVNQPAMETMDALQASRKDLQTFVGGVNDQRVPFGVKRISPAIHDRTLNDVLGGTSMANVRREDLAWAAPPLQQAGPYLTVMDGDGRLTINAKQLVDGQIKPGSVLQVLHPGNPNPFLPATGSTPVLLRPDIPSDQITQSPTSSRSTNNSFTAVLKGGLDDDRLGIDSLARFRSRDGQPAGLVDGGPGVDTLFFSSQRSDLQDPSLNLVGFGSRIRNIEAIEIPINNTLEIDEAPLLNTPLHRLKFESRGMASVNFHVRTPYVLIGDQLDAGLAYSVYERAGSNLQLWVQQGRVSLNQKIAVAGSSAALMAAPVAGQELLSADSPIDSDGLAADPELKYRWYRDGQLIADATAASYGDEVVDTLPPGLYIRETDYTDLAGLRQTVASAPLLVEPTRQGPGGSMRVLRTSLDANQLGLLRSRTPGLEPGAELVQLLLTGTPATQRIALANSSSGSGLVALLDPGQTSPEAVREAGVYDFDNNTSLDTLIWQPAGTTASGASLQTALMQGGRADLAVLANGNLYFVIQDPAGSTSDLEVGTLQSMRVSLLAAPAQGGTVLGIALERGEILADLSKAERRRRAITLLSYQDSDPAPLASRADRDRQLWLRADQELVLLELERTAPSDWDGSLTALSLSPVQSLPASGIAGARLQLGSGSGLRIELEAQEKPQDLNSFVGRSQTQAPVLDFRGLAGLTMEAKIEVAREAAFTSVVGFYAIDNLDGCIRDPVSGALVAPGDSAYGSLAFANRSQDLVGFSSANRTSNSTSLNLTESRLLAPYASVADPNRGLQTFYAFPAANPFGTNHFKSFGNGVLGLEDQAGGGDLDYDDVMIHLKLSPISI